MPVNLLTNQIGQESSFINQPPPPPGSGSTATGIGQFIHNTALNVPGYGALDPTDPVASINATAAYDASLYANPKAGNGSWLQTLNLYGTTANGAAANSQVKQDAIDLDNGAAYDASGASGMDTGTAATMATVNPTQAAAAGANVKAAQVSTNILGIFEEYFVRAVLIILGLIFVGVGLTMFKNPVGDAITAGAKLVPKVVPIPV